MNQGSVCGLPESREVSQSALYPISPGQLSILRRNEGCNVVFHQQRYWMEAPRGFYQPIHWLARHGINEANAPRRWAWGFRTSLSEDAAAQSNGSVPVHLLEDLSTYSFDNFSSGRRYHLRRSQKRAMIVELTGPALLHAEGFAVMQSARERTRYGESLSREQYDAMIAGHVDPLRRLVLAGIVNGRLGGYLGGIACGQTAYIDYVHIATEALSSSLGTGLVYEFVEACRRSGFIREIVYGLHTPEDEALCTFKAGIGFPIHHIPSRVRINPIAARVIRRRSPQRFYRLIGEKQPVQTA